MNADVYNILVSTILISEIQTLFFDATTFLGHFPIFKSVAAGPEG